MQIAGESVDVANPIPNGTDVNAYKCVVIYSVDEKTVYMAATLSNP